MAAKDVFEFRDYMEFFRYQLEEQGGRGLHTRIAEAMGCQPAYLSRVLRGDAHLSAEQTILGADFLGLEEAEIEFLLLLLQRNRAGNPRLQDHWQRRINQVAEKRRSLKSRFFGEKVERLKPDDQVIYYNSWIHGAVHAQASIPGHDGAASIARALRLPLARVEESVRFLVRAGLLRQTEKGLELGTARIHLTEGSALIAKHHTNWRMQSIASLDIPSRSDLHYSAITSLSRQDVEVIRERLLKFVAELNPIINDSASETCFSFGIDFFQVGDPVR